MRFSPALTLMTFASLIVTHVCYRSYLAELPNSHIVPNPYRHSTLWNGLGHKEASGGGGIDCFGEHFVRQGYKWTVHLCRTDSDRDGVTNGQELGDPHCTWVAKSVYTSPLHTHNVSHPGICQPIHSAYCQEQNSMEICQPIMLATHVNPLVRQEHADRYRHQPVAPQLPEISHPDWRRPNVNPQWPHNILDHETQVDTNAGANAFPQQHQIALHTGMVGNPYNTRSGVNVAALPQSGDTAGSSSFTMGNARNSAYLRGSMGNKQPKQYRDNQTAASNNTGIQQVYDNIKIDTVKGLFSAYLLVTEPSVPRVGPFMMDSTNDTLLMINGSDITGGNTLIPMKTILNIQNQINQLQQQLKKEQLAMEKQSGLYGYTEGIKQPVQLIALSNDTKMKISMVNNTATRSKMHRNEKILLNTSLQINRSQLPNVSQNVTKYKQVMVRYLTPVYPTNVTSSLSNIPKPKERMSLIRQNVRPNQSIYLVKNNPQGMTKNIRQQTNNANMNQLHPAQQLTTQSVLKTNQMIRNNAMKAQSVLKNQMNLLQQQNVQLRGSLRNLNPTKATPPQYRRFLPQPSASTFPQSTQVVKNYIIQPNTVTARVSATINQWTAGEAMPSEPTMQLNRQTPTVATVPSTLQKYPKPLPKFKQGLSPSLKQVHQHSSMKPLFKDAPHKQTVRKGAIPTSQHKVYASKQHPSSKQPLSKYVSLQNTSTIYTQQTSQTGFGKGKTPLYQKARPLHIQSSRQPMHVRPLRPTTAAKAGFKQNKQTVQSNISGLHLKPIRPYGTIPPFVHTAVTQAKNKVLNRPLITRKQIGMSEHQLSVQPVSQSQATLAIDPWELIRDQLSPKNPNLLNFPRTNVKNNIEPYAITSHPNTVTRPDKITRPSSRPLNVHAKVRNVTEYSNATKIRQNYDKTVYVSHAKREDWYANIVLIVSVTSGGVAVLIFAVIVLMLLCTYHKRSTTARMSQFR